VSLCKGLKVNQSLLSLNLRCNGLTPKSAEVLFRSLPISLLDLSDNPLGDEGIETICYNFYYRIDEQLELEKTN
jgi:hypothetical protein